MSFCVKRISTLFLGLAIESWASYKIFIRRLVLKRVMTIRGWRFKSDALFILLAFIVTLIIVYDLYFSFLITVKREKALLTRLRCLLFVGLTLNRCVLVLSVSELLAIFT